jgi:hypothetical protein
LLLRRVRQLLLLLLLPPLSSRHLCLQMLLLQRCSAKPRIAPLPCS